jgi:hypothetical protein
MNVIIKHYQDNWQIIKDNALFTIHKFGGGQYPTTKWKKKILMAEHSPIRSGRLIVEVHDIPSFVIGHFVRHNVGFTPFVSTLRDDRTEYDVVPDRLTPNSLRFDGNFQSFINISRKRLCGQASKETRDFWNMVLAAVAEHEPEVYYHCVPECIYRGGCPEFTMCQDAVWSQFVMKQVADSNDLDCFLSINKRYDAWHRFKNR